MAKNYTLLFLSPLPSLNEINAYLIKDEQINSWAQNVLFSANFFLGQPGTDCPGHFEESCLCFFFPNSRLRIGHAYTKVCWQLVVFCSTPFSGA